MGQIYNNIRRKLINKVRVITKEIKKARIKYSHVMMK